MSYESRAYDMHTGDGFPPDPVVVLVVTGTHDVARFVNLLNGGQPVCEQVALGQRIVRQVKRHNAGRAALELLRQHGGPDFTDDPNPDESWNDAVDCILSAVAPELRQAYLNGHDAGFAAANVDDPWAEKPTADIDLRGLVATSDEERGAPATPAEPRVWRKGDPEPADVTRVRDIHGDVWTKSITGVWWTPETTPCGWNYVAWKWAPLTEVVGDQPGGEP